MKNISLVTNNFSVSLNLTNNTIAVDYTKELDWIIPVAYNVVLIMLTSWILLSLIHYGIKTKKWRIVKTSNSNKLNAGLIYVSVTVCAVFCLFYFIINMVYMNIGYNEDVNDVCDSVGDSAVSCYALILFSVNFFWWFRQRVFFHNKMLKVNYNKFVGIASFGSIVVILGSGLAVLIDNCLPNNRFASFGGCTFRPSDDKRLSYWLPIVGCVIFGQSMLLALLAYALKKSSNIKTTRMSLHSTKVKSLPAIQECSSSQIVAYEAGATPSPISSTASKKESKLKSKFRSAAKRSTYRSQNNVRKILKQTLIFAILSTVGDVFNQIFIHYLNDPHKHRRYVIVLSNTNAFLNILFLVLSFVQYKSILLTLFKSRKGNYYSRSG